MHKKVLALSFCLILSACASLTQQGQKALTQGEYDRALSLFQQAIRIDSDDAEAKEGLRHAQQMWLNRKLIDVRLLRLGSNLADSEALLVSILHKQMDWQVFPTGAAFATQNEEIQIFAKRVNSRIEEYLIDGNPLAAQVDFNRNSFILERALDQNLSTLRNNIYVKGRSFCQNTQKSLTGSEYYTGQWLEKTCLIWKQPVKLPPLKNSVVLFGDVKATAKVQGLSPELSEVLNANLKKAFMQSKWHDSKGQVALDLSVEGKFSSEQSEQEVQRTKTYFVQIPYEEKSTRIKDPNRNSGIGGLIGVLSLLAGSSPSERISDNGDGTETVYTTKYRSESRERKYFATEMKSMKKLEGRLSAGLDKQSFTMDLNQRYFFKEDRHKENFPDIGLVPTNPVFITDAEWIRATSEELIGDLSNKLQESWIERFCLPDLVQKDMSEREAMYRCGFQVTAAAPEKLRQFYLKTWKIKYEDWQDLVRSNGGAI